MAIQRDEKWILVVNNNEIEVRPFINHKLTKVKYDTKEEAEEQEEQIKEIMDTLE